MKRSMHITSEYDVIVSPIITEKSSSITSSNQVFFKVRNDATKRDIKSAVEKIFKVNVLGVNTLISKGKVKKFRGRVGTRSDYKKAMVRIKDGQSIDFGAGV